MFYALRYVMTRSTYAVSEVCGIVERNIPNLSKNTKELMVRDLNEEISYRNRTKTGHDCDRSCLTKLWVELSNEDAGVN